MEYINRNKCIFDFNININISKYIRKRHLYYYYLKYGNGNEKAFSPMGDPILVINYEYYLKELNS